MSHHFIAKKPIRQLAEGVFEVWKERSETLAELLIRFRSEKNISEETPITYAGRLDPMAEGIVILLCAEARFEKEKYNALQKTYEVEILFGVETDTLDDLGIVSSVQEAVIGRPAIESAIDMLKDLGVLPYPMYSSRPVDGIPLFVYAREGKEVSLPEKNIKIYAAELLDVSTKTISEIIEAVEGGVVRVKGDFRQDEIVDSWKNSKKDTMHTVATVRITASSGTYMRSVAKWVGEQCGVSAIAHKIVRTEILLS